MKALVTGGNGHIGSHVVRACVAAGIEPVVFARAGSDRRALSGLGVEVKEGDLLDEAALRGAMSGAELVFHIASPHRNFAIDPQDFLRPAVEGTRTVFRAARTAGVRRVVHTSTGATIGFATDPAHPLTEDASLESAASPYIQSKIEAESVARKEGEAGGIEVVVVNPSGVFGPRDYRVTPATRAIVGLLQGDPMFLHVSVTDVRDVAACHVLAATKGASGRRYLATGAVMAPAEGRELFGKLGGVRPATFQPPRFLLSWMAGRMEKKAAAAGTDAPLTRAMVRDAIGKHLAYDSTRARKELGATFRPPEAVLRDTFRWLLFVDALKPKVAAKVRAALGEAAAPDADWAK